MFRKFLIRIRREYNTNRKILFLYTGGMVFLLIAAAVLIDTLFPFSGVYTLIRAMLALTLSIVLFVFGYSISILFHNGQMLRERDTENEEWVPYRLRYSVIWRRRIALIAGAILFVIIYATNTTPAYTTLSASYIAIIYAAIAFIRPTREESLREELNIPDVRDVQYEEYMKTIEREREKMNKLNRKKKKGGSDDDDDDEFEDDEY